MPLILRHMLHTLNHLTPDKPPLPEATSLGVSLVVSTTATAMAPRLSLLLSGALFLALLLLMTIGLGTTYWALRPEERRVFMWEREITGKFMLLVLVVLSLVMDVVIHIAVTAMPAQFGFMRDGALWITMTTLIWLVAAEFVRALRVVSANTGAENVPPTLAWGAEALQWAVRSLRRIDRARWEEAHGKASEPPGRWLDDVTEDEAAYILEALKARRARPEDVASDPRAILPDRTNNARG